jgi:DMSO/TMAO reductase YedYZ molybdopterin-dependent catalytic subunit
MRREIALPMLLVAAVFGLIILLTGCSQKEQVIEDLKPVEIKEYQGENLSSIDDFYMNAIAGTQYIDIDQYRLRVTGLVEKPLEYAYDEVINGYQNYEKVVTLNCVEGWSVKILWEGFMLRDLVADSNPLAEVTTIILKAYDGYSTSFPIEYIMDNDILVAYRMNGIDLPPARGFPFQLVAESKWGYKWIKWVTSIELSDKGYYGYWESRGYSNSGNLDEYYFDPTFDMTLP